MAPVFIWLLLPCVAISSNLGDTLSSQFQSMNYIESQGPHKKTFVPPPPGHNSLHLRRCYFQTQRQIVLQSLLRYDYILYYGGHVPTFNCGEKGTVEQSSSWDGLQQNSFVLPVTSVTPHSKSNLQAVRHNKLSIIGTAISLPILIRQLTGVFHHIE